LDINGTMIVSFHPIYTADQNIICAGRPLDHSDLDAIRHADAVILPQGCSRALFETAGEYCRHVFPDYRVRFRDPGKLGQARLFDRWSIPHPPTDIFSSVRRFRSVGTGMPFPWVIKLNWGGEGHTTFPVEDPVSLEKVLDHITAWERTGQKGFIVQQRIPCRHRSLRVVLIGRHLASYWRVQPRGNQFGTALSAGARIDHEANPRLQEAGRAAAKHFADRAGLQLAGLDYIFDIRKPEKAEPLLLEINYFFGRRGIGGSDRFYHILVQEIDAWLERLNLPARSARLRKTGAA
jgi:ribosomal protein S6--L-glutamate ligase